MEKAEEKIYEEFTGQLCEWAQTGKPPAAGNQDIGYGLKLQRERMERLGIRMEYRFIRRGEHLDTMYGAVCSDGRYTNKTVCSSYRKEVDWYRDNQKCLSLVDYDSLYVFITQLDAAEGPKADDSYCCPNCGAINRVSELLNGCSYCQTRFLISDLFPKVTNFYFLKSHGINDREFKNKVWKWMGGGALAGIVTGFPAMIAAIFHGGSLSLLVAGLLFRGVFFAVLGYFAMAVSFLVRLLSDGITQAPKAVGILRAKKNLTEYMRPFNPGFSFEYFLGKVQGLIKIVIFSEDRSNLAVYEGQLGDLGLDDIVDAQFGGAISLCSSRVEGAYCYLEVKVYMENVYCRNNRLKRQSDQFLMGLCKNISKPEDYGFSIKKAVCKSCGASFDATTERHCPYCKTRYNLKDDDWVVTGIKKL